LPGEKRKDNKFVPKNRKKFTRVPLQDPIKTRSHSRNPRTVRGLKRKGRDQTRPLTATVDELNEGRRCSAPVHRDAGSTLNKRRRPSFGPVHRDAGSTLNKRRRPSLTGRRRSAWARRTAQSDQGSFAGCSVPGSCPHQTIPFVLLVGHSVHAPQQSRAERRAAPAGCRRGSFFVVGAQARLCSRARARDALDGRPCLGACASASSVLLGLSGGEGSARP